MPDGMTAPLYLDAGEPDAATSCTSGSEGGGWKSAHWVTRWPPTLLDAVFFIDLPTPEQRETIWSIYLDAFELDPDQQRPNDDRWTPAEIRACCRLAALLDVPLAQAAQNIVPITATAGESVQRLRNWAGGRCLDAGRSGIYRTATKASPKSRRKIPRDPSVN